MGIPHSSARMAADSQISSISGPSATYINLPPFEQHASYVVRHSYERIHRIRAQSNPRGITVHCAVRTIDSSAFLIIATSCVCHHYTMRFSSLHHAFFITTSCVCHHYIMRLSSLHHASLKPGKYKTIILPLSIKTNTSCVIHSPMKASIRQCPSQPVQSSLPEPSQSSCSHCNDDAHRFTNSYSPVSSRFSVSRHTKVTL